MADDPLDEQTIRRRARSFGPAADVYERARPGYPAEAVEWLVGRSPARVLDVGAGTGKLTRVLAAAGHEVTAVEPDALMRAALAETVPAVEAREGSAEALPVPDASFDAVVAGQAFHWFDRELALPEIARALGPGGVLGVVWNVRDETVDWMAEFGRIVHGGDGTTDLPDEEEDFGPHFAPVERHDFRHTHSLDRAGLVELALSRSHTLTLPESERRHLLEQVDALARREAARSPGGIVPIPYLTVCLRAVRTA